MLVLAMVLGAIIGGIAAVLGTLLVRGDLGIRLPMVLAEIETNPNIDFGDLGTSAALVPSYIPADDEMDLYSPTTPYDASGTLTTTQVTMMWDMNRVLAQNRVSPFGIP